MSERTIDYGERGLVRVVPNAAALAAAAAELVLAITNEAVHERGLATVALSGGSTPKQMGAILREEPYHNEVPWGSTHIFWGDERWVPLSSAESNAGEAIRGYLEAVGIPDDHVYPYLTIEDPANSAAAYESLIRSVVPGSPIPTFDLVLLGMGDDGHMASLFPGTDALLIHDRLVAENHVPKLDTTRLTFTLPLINSARQVAFLAAGAGKADRLSDVLDGPIDGTNLPSQLIRPHNGHLIWLIDEAASANLARNQF